jgi:GDPmannose 4,6-dehydratase
MQDQLFLGNLSSKRDWGHAKDYVKAMYLILQQDQPDDYVIATGVTTSIRDFIRMSCAEIGLEIAFTGEGANEKGYLVGIDEKIYIEKVGEQYLPNIKTRLKDYNGVSNSSPKGGGREGASIVSVDPQYFRPTEVDLLIGDPTKANTKLGWIPQYDLQGLVTDMMQSDIKLMKKDAWLKEGGYRTLNYFE